MNKVKLIAIHLPQFHPIPENDQWWGQGFTEWTNVVKASPRFREHYQPHLPADLGFYDLRLEENRIAQAELARQYGIHGFCYYHYWFNGKRLLNRPLDDLLASHKPDFPFMLCWANENWTRRWDGKDQEVLMHQEYNEEDDIRQMQFLCERFFADQRYIRISNKPFFVMYRPALNPRMRKTIDTWRTVALKCGIGELYLGYMRSSDDGISLQESGFDCAIEFQPDFGDLSPRLNENTWNRLLRKLGVRDSAFIDNRIFDYRDYAKKMMTERKITPLLFPGITPMWDNAARRQKGATIFAYSSPEAYGHWLRHIVESYEKVEVNPRFIFINAWNEWAEGNHLEPCQRWGRQYLEVTKKVLDHA
ncbi:MAG: glycoside hydrolase family 99-like domain-containing protein [Cyclobacteriaceae bacterium]